MLKKMPIMLILGFFTLLACFISAQTSFADDQPAASSSAAATADPDGRIKALEAQMGELRDQNKQLVEQNKQLLDLMQKMADSSKKDEATPTQDSKPAAPAVAIDQYAPGWRARIISVPYNFNITDKLPALELGSFVATKSEYRVYDYLKILNGAAKVNFPLWKGEAFLNVEEPGNYVFSFSPTAGRGAAGPNAYLALFVEDVLIASSQGSGNSLIGAAELEPGLYKIEFRFVEISRIGNTSTDERMGFNILIKRPSDDQGVPVSDVLLVKKAPAAAKTQTKKK